MLLIIGFLCFASGVGIMLRGTFESFAMIGELNAKLPVEKQFNQLWWGPFKKLRFREEYKAAFPGSRRLLRNRLIGLVGIALILLGAFLFVKGLPQA